MEADPSTPPKRGRVRKGGRVLAAIGLALVLFVVGGVGLFRTIGNPSPAPATTDSGSTGSALSEQPVILSGTLQQAIASLQQRLRAAPQDWESWANLGLAYVQEARVTADPRYYPKAQGASSRSLRLHPDANSAAYTGERALALARLDLAGVLRWSAMARAVSR